MLPSRLAKNADIINDSKEILSASNQLSLTTTTYILFLTITKVVHAHLKSAFAGENFWGLFNPKISGQFITSGPQRLITKAGFNI